jgi:hypothetical protein
MRVAVITCDAFRDAWEPFRALFTKFWPECPYPVTWYSDNGTASWCSVVLGCANESNAPILLLQEDFFMSQPVRQSVVEHGLRLMMLRNAGALRLYPSVGGIDDIGDPYFAAVPRGTRYRLSCQASIWNPEYLAEIARRSMETTSEAGDFENLGGPQGDLLPNEVLAFKRDLKPWPFEYIATAIVRGRWNPDALKLCAEHGIAIDTSRRAIA